MTRVVAGAISVRAAPSRPSAAAPEIALTIVSEIRPANCAAPREPATRIPMAECARSQRTPPAADGRIPVWATPTKKPMPVPAASSSTRFSGVPAACRCTACQTRATVASRQAASLATACHGRPIVKKYVRHTSCATSARAAKPVATNVARYEGPAIAPSAAITPRVTAPA